MKRGATSAIIGSVDTQIPDLARVRRALLRWHRRNALPAPWRESADPYACLVAAFMAQQTQMSRVLPAFERFMSAFPALDALAVASRADVLRAWRGMGYNRRAVRLHEAAREIAATGWPRDAASLARVEGIGPFTAAVVASFAFGERAACIDTNVRRVLGRIAGTEAMARAPLRALADAAVPETTPGTWNHALMDFGALVCTPRPRCAECPIAGSCASRGAFSGGHRVAEERGRYIARALRKREAPWHGSTRFWRGRIVDALRDLPPGRSLALKILPHTIANGHAPPSPALVRELVSALERDGLATVRRGLVRLPD
jgi:A/G-specific adenine glycosylase